jgi:hypothetical protein
VVFHWTRPLLLEPGDVVSAEIAAALVREEYVWSWQTRSRTGGTGALKAVFNQSTLFGTPLSPTSLKKRAAEYVPALTDEGRILLRALTLMGDRLAAGEIARQLRDNHPERFPRSEDAVAYVGDLANQYG